MTPQQLSEVVEHGIAILEREGEMSFRYLLERLKDHYCERGETLPGQRGIRGALLEGGRVIERAGYPHTLEAVSC